MLNIQTLLPPFCCMPIPEYLEESTNFQTNPFNAKKSELKQRLLEEHSDNEDIQMGNSRTVNFKDLEGKKFKTKLPQKITSKNLKSNKDNEETLTFKGRFDKLEIEEIQQQEGSSAQNSKTKLKFTTFKKVKAQADNYYSKGNDEAEALISTISTLKPLPKDNKTQSVLQSTNLRERFAKLIPQAHQRTIAFEHHHLLKIMSIIDNTIQFSCMNRSTKYTFFNDLRRKILATPGISIYQSHLQQLLFLDEQLYNVKWEINQSRRCYDIMITLPKIDSKSSRLEKVRKNIVIFLDQKHEEFLKEKDLKHSKLETNWHKDFKPEHYMIPLKRLPPHPETRDAELRTLDQKQISDIRNENVKKLIQNKIDDSDSNSVSSKAVMKMIFSGKTTSKDIEKTLYEAVQSREEQQAKARLQYEKKKQSQPQVNGQLLRDMSQQILFMYVSKSVSNMFKAILLDKVLDKFNMKNTKEVVEKHFEHLLSLKEIGFLKEATLSNKRVVVQMFRNKHAQVLEYCKKQKHGGNEAKADPVEGEI